MTSPIRELVAILIDPIFAKIPIVSFTRKSNPFTSGLRSTQHIIYILLGAFNVHTLYFN